ncbi:MAG: FAD-dependent oxidoreductase [bacterium]
MTRRTNRTRIAVIGAGGAGSCTALELARRGHGVELFERHNEAVSQATFVCEGKIHLGLIYAKDASLATARQMIDGALAFESLLQRWLPFNASAICSTPFYYGVHRGSLMAPEALEEHYRRCKEYHDDRAASLGLDYLGLGTGCRTRRLSESEYPDGVDPAPLEALFETTEYAIDPRALSADLRRALAAEPRIRLRLGHRVTAIEPLSKGGYRIVFEHEGRSETERFSDVANTSWYERLPLDRPMGILPQGRYSHRYKFGHRIALPIASEGIPSLTYVQGPFGDVVNFRSNGLFLSWYPIGRTGMSTDETPPDWHARYHRSDRMAVFHSSFEAWRRRCPALATLAFAPEQVDPNGGVIYALGTTDVDDAGSRLHERREIGIQSVGRYHSLDPGKFTLVPWWAPRLADRIEAAAG